MLEILPNKKIIVKRIICPLCNNNDIYTLIDIKCSDDKYLQFLKYEPTYDEVFYEDFKKYLFDEHFKVSKCRKCDFIFQNNILNNIGMKKLYDEWISPTKVASLHMNREFGEEYNLRVKFLSNYFNRKLNILDWGAGFGDFCLAASAAGHKTYSYEFSYERINFMKQVGIEVFTNDNIPTEYFDYINVDQVLEHVPDPFDVLSRKMHLRNHLKVSSL